MLSNKPSGVAAAAVVRVGARARYSTGPRLDKHESDPKGLGRTVIGHRTDPPLRRVPTFSVGYGTAAALMRLWRGERGRVQV